MKRAYFILAVFITSTAWYGCGVTKKSTMHRLKNRADAIDSMLLPSKDTKSAKPVELIDAQKIKIAGSLGKTPVDSDKTLDQE